MSEPLFQEAATLYALRRLTDPRGTHRFLLADEVGLGKTHIAAGVVKGLREGREGVVKQRQPRLRVAYVCSSQAILAQNRDRFGVSSSAIGRITEALLKGTSVKPLVALTPGVSLMGGLGRAWERKLLLQLVKEQLGVGKTRAYETWSGFFKGPRVRRSWDFARHVELRSQAAARLGKEWRTRPKDGPSLKQELISAVADWSSARRGSRHRERANRERARVIGKLRMSLQREALRTLRIGLVILDEVQRYRWLIECETGRLTEPGVTPHPAAPLARELLGRKRKVLLLSATPWRSLSFDETAQQSEFSRTLAFLFGSSPEKVDEVEQLLAGFKRRLDEFDPSRGVDDQLRSYKRRIEKLLRPVMSRTERRRYVDDTVAPGVTSAEPSTEEIEEYLLLRKYLLTREDASGCITDYWKSFPSPLTFMDRGYKATRDIARRRNDFEAHLVTRPNRLRDLPGRHGRLGKLLELMLPSDRSALPRLWVPPSYRYYRDDTVLGQATGSTPPGQKLLVFSAWRFVPKAIALVTSAEVEHRLGLDPSKTLASRTRPLRLWHGRAGDRLPQATLDVCFPSLGLARLVQPSRDGNPLNPPDALVETVRQSLKDALARVNVKVGPEELRPSITRWAAALRLESDSDGSRFDWAHMRRQFRVLGGVQGTDADGSEERIRRLIHSLERCRLDRDEVTLSSKDLDGLARTAVFSPAVCMARALRSACAPGSPASDAVSLVALCLGPLRRWLNRNLTQAVVRKAAGAGSTRIYSAMVLDYCRAAHFPSVADEFAYMLLQGTNPPVEEWARALSVGSGIAHVNTSEAGGRPGSKMLRTHYALSLGEESGLDEDQTDGEAVPGVAAICRAFNSPFWPFVLATTSVGQEGLDFHGYCRDIVHWNLPASPVELEQREGRLTRRDGLAIRAAVAQDWPLDALRREEFNACPDNPFSVAFAAIEADPHRRNRLHGLDPHWIYQFKRSERSASQISRHLIFFESSEDHRKFRGLEQQAMLYRLVFGQPGQAELLGRLERRHARLDREDLANHLPAHLLDLSPVHATDLLARARRTAKELIDRNGLRRLIDDVEAIEEHRSAELRSAYEDLRDLKDAVRRWMSTPPQAPRPQAAFIGAVTALVYLRDPYDREFDRIPHLGLADDCAVIGRAAQTLRGTAIH